MVESRHGGTEIDGLHLARSRSTPQSILPRSSHKSGGRHFCFAEIVHFSFALTP